MHVSNLLNLNVAPLLQNHDLQHPNLDSLIVNLQYQTVISLILSLLLFLKKEGLQLEVTNSILLIIVSTSVSVSKQFPARTPQYQASNYPTQEPRKIVPEEIHIPAWPIHYSKDFNLFHLSSFTENGCIFPKIIYIWSDERINSQRLSLILPYYCRNSFHYCVF